MEWWSIGVLMISEKVVIASGAKQSPGLTS
jgi:hypothetical protein